ncbi:hypothetical protein ACP6PM_03995 [Dapis sp. BLCC M229]
MNLTTTLNAQTVGTCVLGVLVQPMIILICATTAGLKCKKWSMTLNMKLQLTKRGYISMPQQISLEILRHLSETEETSSKQLASQLGYCQNYIKQIASEMVKSKMILSSRRGYLAINPSQK